MDADKFPIPAADKPSPKPQIRPRQSQVEIWKYERGKMGVSAVPGSGKTFTLSHLAAKKVEELIAKNLTQQGADALPEVLVVTFTNTAVNSFKAKIAEILRAQRGLLPYIGYRVRTLHGLAHDIVRERPSLVGLAEDFQILDDRVSAAILRASVIDWLRTSGDALMTYVDQAGQTDQGEEEDEATTSRFLRRIQQEYLPELAIAMATGFIGEAKDLLFTPAMLRAKLIEVSGSKGELALARFGVEVYEGYQRSLAYRGAVDFDDLVRLALEALDRDPAYLERLQKQWPYIFEDEAQDSSRLQEKMLSLLAAKHGNWVRVGDPNQSINTTFTTATPQFLRDFLKKPGVKAITLDQAGRSAQPIIDLANSLMRWATKSHPVPVLWKAFYYQEIKPTAPGDDQPNPAANEGKIHIQYEAGKEISPEQERKIVVASLEKWLPENPDRTVAVLVPQNSDGFQLSEILHARGIAYEELLRSTTATRETAKALRNVLDFLAAPIDGGKLARVYREVWWPAHLGKTLGESGDAWRDDASGALSKCRTVEAFLWPASGMSLDVLILKSDDDALTDDLDGFRLQVVRWLEGRILPIDQLLLTIGHDLFTEAAEIALNYNIAQVLRSMARENPDWRLPQFAEELRAVSENERKFLDFDDAAQGYEPKAGRVTVATMHAAKGLEWDRVYLMSVSNYAFPSAQAFDRYISEKWFIRDQLNLEAETLAQLHTLTGNKPYVEGEATKQARIDYAAERLRLLYVGITRAKRELIITWNTGRFASKGGTNVNQPALPLVILSESVNGNPGTSKAKP